MTDTGSNFGRRYYELREELAGDIRRGLVRATPEALTDRLTTCAGLNKAEAGEAAERFFADVQRHAS